MSRDPEVPVQLRVVGATDLERQLLNAAATERPSDELTRRMGAALGLALTAGTAAVAEAAPAAQSAAHTTVAASSTSAWPALTIGVVAVVAAGVASVHWARGHHIGRTAIVAAAPAAVAPTAPSLASDEASDEASDGVAPRAAQLPRPHHAAAPAAAGAAPRSDLRAEIALIDATRNAVAAHDDDRALALVRRYEATYPGGTFRPEAAVLRIEALANLGRSGEARTLARRFIAAHPDNPLADRVARLAR
jgi:hypothetical protein